MPPENGDNFTFTFFIWMPFGFYYYYFCLIDLARTSSTMLNGRVERRQPGFLPDLREKASSLLPLSMMLAVDML